jgi:hypothetical protein
MKGYVSRPRLRSGIRKYMKRWVGNGWADGMAGMGSTHSHAGDSASITCLSKNAWVFKPLFGLGGQHAGSRRRRSAWVQRESLHWALVQNCWKESKWNNHFGDTGGSLQPGALGDRYRPQSLAGLLRLNRRAGRQIGIIIRIIRWYLGRDRVSQDSRVDTAGVDFHNTSGTVSPPSSANWPVCAKLQHKTVTGHSPASRRLFQQFCITAGSRAGGVINRWHCGVESVCVPGAHLVWRTGAEGRGVASN